MKINPHTDKIIDTIIKERTMQNISRNQLAKLSGVNVSTVSILIAKKANSHEYETIAALCSALNIKQIDISKK